MDLAINRIQYFKDQFMKDSFGFIRFDKFMKVYTIAKEINFESELRELEILSSGYTTLVFLYNKAIPDKSPIIYSSINKTLKSLFISHGTLINHITNKYILTKNKEDFILSFEPLSSENISEYSYKSIGDNQLRKNVILFNENLDPVFEFHSAREMARHFKIDGKKARSNISSGKFLEFTIITKPISFRRKVFVYDNNTLNLIKEFQSITAAIEYAKVNFLFFRPK